MGAPDGVEAVGEGCGAVGGGSLEDGAAAEGEPADGAVGGGDAVAGVSAEDDGGSAEEPAEELPPHDAHMSAPRTTPGMTITDLIGTSSPWHVL